MSGYDAVVVGAGHNGLAASVILAKAGWRVLVLERNERPGGCIRTEEVTLPGFKHDLFATNLNLFAGSPFFQEFGPELVKAGMEFVPASKPFGSVFPGGRFLGVSTDLDETLAAIKAFSEADAAAWKRLLSDFQQSAPYLFSLLGVPMPSLSLAAKIWKGRRALGHQWTLNMLRLLVQSPREFVENHFESPEVKALCCSWGMHLDFSPEVAGGALFPYLESMVSQANGMVVGKGGARLMVDALVGLLESCGGTIRCSQEVTEIMVRNGTAVGVRLSGGEEIRAEKAVIANLAPSILFGGMVKEGLSEAFLGRVRRFRHGPGTMMIHLALAGLPEWEAGTEVQEWLYVHAGPYLADMNRCYEEALEGFLPESPFLVIGQPTAIDPSRAPQGRHILWIQVRVVPGRIAGDSLGEIQGREWEAVKEAYADRIISKIERFAPGLKEQILGRCVLSPDDLQGYNPNLVGGDSLGGSHHLLQNFLFRPFPGWSRYRTPIARLFMCGASTWPGAGVGAGSGRLLGKMLAG